jgi:hypothetical protein
MLGLSQLGVKTLEELSNEWQGGQAEVLLMSVTYTGLAAPSIVRSKIMLNEGLLASVEGRAKDTWVFCRRDLVEHVVEQGDTWEITLDEGATKVKDFRSMYKVVQKVLSDLEAAAEK